MSTQIHTCEYLRRLDAWTVPSSLTGEDRTSLDHWLQMHWPSILNRNESFVKQDTVARVAICDGIVLKEYRARSNISGHVAGLVRSRASKTFRIGERLRAAGLPVPHVLAMACQRRAGSIQSEFLLTKEVRGSRRVTDVLASQNLDIAILHAVINQMGKLLGRFHSMGFYNRDMKIGNLVISQCGEQVALWSVDLDGCRFRGHISDRRVLRDFQPILHSLSVFGLDTPETRKRLLSSYAEVCGRPPSLHALPKVKRYPWKNNSGWMCVERTIRVSGLAKRKIWIHFPNSEPKWEQYALQFWQGALTHLTPVAGSPEASVSKGSIENGEKTYYFKTFFMRSELDVMKSLARGSRARRSWRGNALAATKGFAVPFTKCLIEVQESGLLLRSALVTEEVAGAVPLPSVLKENMGATAVNGNERLALAAALGREVGRWHNAGIVHGDMRLGNVLLKKMDASLRFYFVDNERTRATSSRHERVRNLMQLNMLPQDKVTVRERLTAWHAYRQMTGMRGRQMRNFRADIFAWTQKRWEKSRKT